MNNEQINHAIDTLKEHMGTEAFLEELLTVLSNDELDENLDHIIRMWDIDL